VSGRMLDHFFDHTCKVASIFRPNDPYAYPLFPLILCFLLCSHLSRCRYPESVLLSFEPMSVNFNWLSKDRC
jgi:hypothetical protein